MASSGSDSGSSMVHEQDGKDLERAWKDAESEAAARSSLLQCWGKEYTKITVQVWGSSGMEEHPTLLAQSDWEAFTRNDDVRVEHPEVVL